MSSLKEQRFSDFEYQDYLYEEKDVKRHVLALKTALKYNLDGLYDTDALVDDIMGDFEK